MTYGVQFTGELVDLRGHGEVRVVGENYHASALEEFLAQRRPGELGVAVLIPEPTNPHDDHAVRVELLSHGLLFHVGYLSQDESRAYHDVLLPLAGSNRYGTVRANVWKGDSSTRVFLRLDEADRILGKSAPVRNGEVLDARWSATVTGEESYQDVLNAGYADREGPMMTLFGLDFTTILTDKQPGNRAIRVSLDGRPVGNLTTMLSDRYRVDVSELLDSGKVPFAEGSINRDSKGRLQVELYLPAHR